MLSTEPGRTSTLLQWLGHSFFLGAAFFFAIFPTVIKMYETSHWYREGDPSKYDNAKDWFSNPKLPFHYAFENPKVLMRIYFFIIPYILCAFFLAIKNLIPKQTNKSSDRKPDAWLIIQSIFRRTIYFPKLFVMLGSADRVTLSEAIGVVVFLSLNLGTFVVRVIRSLPRGTTKLTFLVQDGDAGKEPIGFWSWEACEIWAKTLGVISILNLGWYLMLPIGKRSVILEALGLSWEYTVKFHRWIGYYSVFLMSLHGIMYIAVWTHGNGHLEYDPDRVMVRHNLVPWGCPVDECNEFEQLQLRVNMYGIVALFLVLAMTGFALPFFRRHKFEWFYYFHHLFIVVILFVCLHYSGSIIYLIPGMTIYGVDKLLGLLAYLKAGLAETKLVTSDVLEMTIYLGSNVSYEAGQYIFLNVPTVSYLEWHPFSITSAPNVDGNKVTFHIKAAGDWTQKVIDTAYTLAATPSKGFLKVRLDGFYGCNAKLALQNKQGAIFVGGGIGVTPMMSVAIDLCQTHPNIPVALMWVVRTVEEFNVFADDLCQAKRRFGSRLSIQVWITLSFNSGPSNAVLENGCNYVELSKAEVSNLTPDEQCDRVDECLRELKESVACSGNDKKGSMKNPTESTSLFVMDKAGLTPVTNASVMCIAMVLGLSGYALSQKININNAIEPQDKLVLLDLALVACFLFIFLAVLVGLRRAMTRWGRSTDRSETSWGAYESNSESGEKSSDSERGEYPHQNNQHTMDLIHEMILGRVGCRPNIAAEFLGAATFSSTGQKSTKHDSTSSGSLENHPSDIGVLACGPLALLDSIDRFCNNSSCSTCGHRGGDGSKFFFTFHKEDWAW